MTRSLLAAASLAATLGLVAPASAQTTAPQPPQITVEGHAQELVLPDALRIVVGVETHGASHLEAMAENATVVARVVAAARQRGVATTDLQTGRIDLRPESASTAAKLGAFRAVNLVSVTARRVADADQLTAALLAAGANRIHGVTPLVERSAERAARLRDQAIASAREVAEQSVRAANARLGPILSIRTTTEERSGGVGPTLRSAGPAPAVPIEEGRVPMAVDVTMTWLIVQ